MGRIGSGGTGRRSHEAGGETKALAPGPPSGRWSFPRTLLGADRGVELPREKQSVYPEGPRRSGSRFHGLVDQFPNTDLLIRNHLSTIGSRDLSKRFPESILHCGMMLEGRRSRVSGLRERVSHFIFS